MTAALLGLLLAAQQPARVFDAFDDPSAWTAHPADGVTLTLAGDRGRRETGRALRLDFAFLRGGGYAIARRALDLALPANYAITFWIRGTSPPNALEFKLVDESGESVWWYVARDVPFDGAWRQLTIRRRQITFAWGPAGGGELRRVAAIEFAITAGRGGGGTGSVWIDDLALMPLPVAGPYDGTPTVTASGTLPGYSPSAALDGDTATAWRGPALAATSPLRLTVDFGKTREFGGLTLLWEPGRRARRYTVLVSDDGRAWHEVWRVREGDGPRDHIYLPDSESRYVRLALERSAGETAFGLRELRVEPLAAGASRNAFFEAVARDAPPGDYPRAFGGARAPWTVVGADGAREEALLGQDGALEAGEGAFSIEPVLRVGGRLLTWADVAAAPALARGDLPVPSVRWQAHGLTLTITAFTTGPDTASSVVARYRLVNTADTIARAVLYLAVRPFQVNPPFQFLNVPGGVARIDSLRWDGCRLFVNGDRAVVPLTAPARVLATPFERGEIVTQLRRGEPAPRDAVRDPFGAASAALAFPLTMAPGGSWTVSVEIPLVAGREPRLEEGGEPAAALALAEAVSAWEARLPRTLALPAAGAAVARTVRSTLAYILINRDGPALQPGSRAYARSWIRDGALTSAALLRFGYAPEVRAYLEWYARHLYPNGKVPCCVDGRGADPVPEHDSHGEWIYLVAEYYRHTGDRALVERLWPGVAAAADYLDSLRQTRRSPEFATGDRKIYFGLLPPSISHEGYSAKPMHSYWDDFFALRGFKDAVALARVLGHEADAARFSAMRDEFQHELAASLERAMAHHGIPYLPGAADLGDFDATSTTIAVAPGGELARLPRAALEATFERYWREAAARRDSGSTWEAYTPYELRAVGTFVRLGWRSRALALLDQLLADQEPPAWNQWPEVVWRDRRAPRFVGDLPHGWVGADFLRSVADLFAYERESDSALVVGAGVAEAWLADSGVTVRDLGTWWGPLRYRARAGDGRVLVRVSGALRIPPGGLLLVPPGDRAPRRVTVDGGAAVPDAAGAVRLRAVPADVVFEY